MSFLRDKKYIWLPAVLLVYALCVAWINRDTVTVEHKYMQYFGSLAAELVILAFLVVFLKKRRDLKEKREQLKRKSDGIIEEAKVSAEVDADETANQ